MSSQTGDASRAGAGAVATQMREHRVNNLNATMMRLVEAGGAVRFVEDLKEDPLYRRRSESTAN